MVGRFATCYSTRPQPLLFVVILDKMEIPNGQVDGIGASRKLTAQSWMFNAVMKIYGVPADSRRVTIVMNTTTTYFYLVEQVELESSLM